MLCYHIKYLKSEALVKKSKIQKSFAAIIIEKPRNPAILILSVFLTMAISYVLGLFFNLSIFQIASYILGFILFLMLGIELKIKWVHHINNCNYNWFWKVNKVDLTKLLSEDTIDTESLSDNNIITKLLNDFLNSLDNDNWYIESSKIKVSLVFRNYEDMIQCKMII